MQVRRVLIGGKGPENAIRCMWESAFSLPEVQGVVVRQDLQQISARQRRESSVLVHFLPSHVRRGRSVRAAVQNAARIVVEDDVSRLGVKGRPQFDLRLAAGARQEVHGDQREGWRRPQPHFGHLAERNATVLHVNDELQYYVKAKFIFRRHYWLNLKAMASIMNMLKSVKHLPSCTRRTPYKGLVVLERVMRKKVLPAGERGKNMIKTFFQG